MAGLGSFVREGDLLGKTQIDEFISLGLFECLPKFCHAQANICSFQDEYKFGGFSPS